MSNYPDRDSTTDDSDRVRQPSTTAPRHNYPEIEKMKENIDPDMKDELNALKIRMKELEYSVKSLQELVEKLREHISSVIQITSPDFADHFE